MRRFLAIARSTKFARNVLGPGEIRSGVGASMSRVAKDVGRPMPSPVKELTNLCTS